MKRFMHFLQYHNAALVILVVVFGAATSVFAASENARDAVFDTTQQVVSIDNTYLLQQDFDTYDFEVEITSVSEDTDFYYVEYQYSTIQIINDAWQRNTELGSLKVSRKQILGQDLGEYVARQLAEVTDFQKKELVQIQERERGRGESRKVVATLYSGLVGKMLDTKTQEFPGYAAVVKEKEKPKKEKVTSGADTNSSKSVKIASQVSTIANGSTRSSAEAPVITILGKNPARVWLDSKYADWGVSITDDKDFPNNLQLWLQVEGDTDIDTSVIGTSEVRYSVTDSDGNTATALRIVEVYDPNAGSVDIETDTATTTPEAPVVTQPTSTSTTQTATTTEPAPEPVVESEPEEPVVEPTPEADPAPDTATTTPETPVE